MTLRDDFETRTPSDDPDDTDRGGTPGDEQDGGPSTDDEPIDPAARIEQLQERIERQDRTLRQFIAERSNLEAERRAVRDLADTLTQSFRQVAQRPEDDDEGALSQVVDDMRTSDDPKDKVILRLGAEVHGLRQELRGLIDERKTKIPDEHQDAVDQLMRSGQFASRKAAYAAHIGQLAMEGKWKPPGATSERPGDGAGDGAGGAPRTRERVGTFTRPVSRPGGQRRTTLTSSEYRERLAGPEGRQWLQRVRDGKVRIVKDEA